MKEGLVGFSNCVHRLYQCLSKCVQVVCCYCSVNKVSTSKEETRVLQVGYIDENDRKQRNTIKTSRYSLLTFLPKNLVEQFRRIANFYFLIVTVIAIVIDSPVSPLTSILPLTFMVMVTAAKQGYEDWLRHRADNKVNNQTVEIVHKGVIKEIRNAKVAPGTLVRVKRGHDVPADLVVLCSADERGKCYVTTANLDGETNLKTLRVPPPLVGYTPDIMPANIRIEVPQPVTDLYTFYGTLEIPGRETLTMSTEHIMLRGSKVKNTEWAVGCAVYTGEETKLALNSRYSSNKFSSCESAINGFLYFFIGILAVVIFVSYGMKLWFDSEHKSHEVYLGASPPLPPGLTDLTQDLFSFLLLYYYVIPMSLYVTIELYKFIGALYIGWDEDLKCEETGRPALANTSDLNEELGQIEVLFSDKTGTLTKNLMVFKSCSVNGRVYQERDGKMYDTCGFDEPEDIFKTDIKFFFTILSLCHSVQVSSDEMKKLTAKLSANNTMKLLKLFKREKSSANGSSTIPSLVLNTNESKMDYQASSPDEKALVEAAESIGITFLGEDGNNFVVKIGNETELYERLQVLEFTSERKRMSVILKDKNGKIWLFCKGAESSVIPLCKDGAVVEETYKDINMFANKGLRTLAIAYREISEQEYNAIAESLKRSEGVQRNASLQALTQQFRTLESDMTLIGATGVQDCLQDDVAETLAALRRAGIRIWVLTGDKVETAMNVAQSCAHISENDKRMFLVEIKTSEMLERQMELCLRQVREPGYQDLTLIVDGSSMDLILDTTFADKFVEVSLKCNAVLCCRLSPIQKAKIVKLIKCSRERPVTAAIGDGANDISMIQEAHVGIGIFGKEGYQAARSADFAFTKFSMIKKVILVMGPWYYERLATLIHYFFYKNLVFVNIMLYFQIISGFSTQSIFDSMYLSLYNLVFTSVPCFILSVTEQRWPLSYLLHNPTSYRKITKNKLMSWKYFSLWLSTAVYHSVILYVFSILAYKHCVINKDGRTIDLWCFGAILFHFFVLIVNLKLLLQARYQTWAFVISVAASILSFVLFNTVYSIIDIKFDGDVNGTYTRLLASPTFWLTNILFIVAVLLPDSLYRIASDTMSQLKYNIHIPTRIFTTRL